MNNKKRQNMLILITILVVILAISSCTRVGEDVDLADLGYGVEVTYDALGGVINQREVRHTNYAENSLLFEPSGSTNLLIEPVKTGYTLAGWYTDRKEIQSEEGQESKYEFDAQDRWDFNVDRVQEDITLYARWVNQAKANYINAETGEIVFSKDVTATSPLSSLSTAILNMVSEPGYTFQGYFHDNLKEEIDFDKYGYAPLLPSDQELYDQLAEEFPQNILPYQEENHKESDEEIDGDLPEENTNWEFLMKLGYELKADDADLEAIKFRKNEIIDEYINNYIVNNEANDVYLVFEEGIKVYVSEVDDINNGGKYGFADLGDKGEYYIEEDLNMGEASFSKIDHFSGLIDGQGHTLSNIHLKISFAKKDALTGGRGAMFTVLEGATIKDITFKNMTIEINGPPGVDVQAAVLAVDAVDSSIENVVFDGLEIITGNGDNGLTSYELSDFILNNKNTIVNNVAGNDIIFDVSSSAIVYNNF